MKKRIIVVSHNMRIGGVERSLAGLLDSFDYGRYDVDLFLYIHDGELMPLINPNVHLYPENRQLAASLLSLKEILKRGAFMVLLAKILAKIEVFFFYKKSHLPRNGMIYFNYLHRYLSSLLPEISNKEYDLSISFLTPHHIAAHNFRSKKKIAWIHTDYSFFEFDDRAELDMWGCYDHIASISESASVSFLKKFPELQEKVIVIENILHPDHIRSQAESISVENEIPSEKGVTTICSVGRFCEAKNFDNVPAICKLLIEKGHSVRWYLIGFGDGEDLVRQRIDETGMGEYVRILGKKENPYPYIKACDLYVQPSRFEGKAVTVTEAQILEKPVVITNYSTSSAQIRDRFDGIIVPLDNSGCADGIDKLIRNKEMQAELIKNCSRSDYSNRHEVMKIYNVIENG